MTAENNAATTEHHGAVAHGEVAAGDRGGHVEPTHQTEKYHHGRTPAAWTGVAIAIIGAVISTVGFFMNINWYLALGGLVIALLGGVVGGVMSKMGYGQE